MALSVVKLGGLKDKYTVLFPQQFFDPSIEPRMRENESKELLLERYQKTEKTERESA